MPIRPRSLSGHLSRIPARPILAAAPLRDFLRKVGSVLGPQTTLYLFLDQFEEFFTRTVDADRAVFVNDLAECLDDTSLNVRWVLALRTEFFGKLSYFRPRIPNPFANDLLLQQLKEAEARIVMTEPAKRRGLAFEVGLVDSILNDLGQAEIAPPQIQLVCLALCEELKSGETLLTKASYEQAGGAAGILRGHLERVLSRDLTPSQRTTARRLLESLITSEQQRVIRARSDLVAELARRGMTPEVLDVILTQLVDSRLIRAEETEAGLAYELTHDYLLTEIKLDPQVQARKAAQELLEQETRAYQRNRKLLLTVDHLAVIEPYRTDLTFTPEAGQLFLDSQRAVQRERKARQRRVQLAFLALGIFALVVSVLAVIALVQRNEAQHQTEIVFAGKLAAQGQNAFEDNPLLGLRLALEGYAFAPANDVDSRLSTANTIRQLIAPGRVLKLGGNVEQIFPNKDISSFVLDHLNRPGELWRTAERRLVTTLAGAVDKVRFSPDSAATYFSVQYSDAPAELRRTLDGSKVSLSGIVTGIYFSADPKADYFIVSYSDSYPFHRQI
jgi:hypothetical protein